jgi:hypothetical protein
MNDNGFFLNKLYTSNLQHYQYNLFFSLIITQIYYSTIFLVPYFNEFSKHMLKSLEYLNLGSLHPEI